jgi:hypothetical protein
MTVCGSARRTARTADSGKLRIGETEHEGESSLHTHEASDDLLVDGRAATREIEAGGDARVAARMVELGVS